MENERAAPSSPKRAWPLFLAGIVLFIAGIGIYFVQVATNHLKTPWHLPILGTLGVLCMAISVVQRVGVLRCVGLALFMLLCGLEWVTVAWLSKTPAYTGPAEGSKIPAFTAAYADGRPFTPASLEDGNRTAIVFFRGHW